MAQPNSVPVPLERTRQQVILELCQHYSLDNLSDEALEQRLDQAHAAGTLDELRALTADLPVAQQGAAASAGGAFTPAIGSYNAEHQVIVGIMGGAERRGAWSPARATHVVAIMGGVELDLREARFAPGVTEITVFAVMGGAEIIVPPGVHVDMNGFAFMGGFGQRYQSEAPTDPHAPILRIGGFALMGGVDISIMYPGERPRDARARIKVEREQRRLERRTR
ncbi:MAG TPA: DUF1707 domain-containing protein [Longimicrobium sp.]|jgi:hypothetical protein|uniref:DUF1707 SHOCT-like domain-containing protein n=1 Tax=Longimicrobium sp. TaxID=2029185 RepID=UPI002ED8D5FD